MVSYSTQGKQSARYTYTMKFLLVCLLVGTVACTDDANYRRGLDTFQFGINVGRVSFTATGSFERQKFVKVDIPDCSILKYVRVDVNSYDQPPKVNFNWRTKVVTLRYPERLRIIPTQYTIKAKAIPNANCLSKSA